MSQDNEGKMKLSLLLAAALTIAPCFAEQVEFADTPFGTQTLILNGSIDVSAVQTGWYFEDGTHDSTNPNYLTGFCDATCADAGGFHSFFVFDIPDDLTITSASLSLGNSGVGYNSPNSSEPLEMFDVSTPVSTLEASQSDATGIYDDLGGGTMYGTTAVGAASDGNQVVVNLDAAAISALNSAEGSDFALGGTLGVNATEVSTVPEPSSVFLLATALGLGLFVRRPL